MDIILFTKTKLKKYLPSFIYSVVYVYYIKLKSIGKKDKNDLLLTTFTSPLFKRVTVDEVSFDIKIDPDNGCVDKEIYKNGVWEESMLREIKKHIHKDSICLDVGANIGQHTLFMASVATSGKVYAFEPVERLARQIRESVEYNKLSNVEICGFGLSQTNSKQKIYLDNLNMGKTSFQKNVNTSSDVMTAEVRVFDDWWQDRSEINFIKIDVEGYEYYALQGMQKALEKNSPIIILEYSPHFYRQMDFGLEKIPELLFSLGYSLFDLEQSNLEVNKSNLNQWIEETKIQTNILCIKK